MNKSTKAISLVLMGSALALAGCSSRTDEEEEDRVAQGGHHRHGGFIPVIIPGSRGGVSRGGSVSAGASARGGFGGIGGVSSSS